jgi:hypothetical protein
MTAEHIDDCDTIVHAHDDPRPEPTFNPAEGVIYSDDRVRVWKMYNIGHTPEKGKWMVRVDIWPERQR